MSYLLLVNDALSAIGVLPEGQDASAEQGTLALREASNMVEDWADDGVVVTFDPNPTLDGDCPLHGTELNAVKYSLAVRLCPHFGREPSGALAMMAGNAWNRLLRQQLVAQIAPADPVLPVPDALRDSWSILE